MSGRSNSSVKSKSAPTAKSSKAGVHKRKPERKQSASNNDTAPENRHREESQESTALHLTPQDRPVQESHENTRCTEGDSPEGSLNEGSGRQEQKARTHTADDVKAQVIKNRNGRDTTKESTNGLDKRRQNDRRKNSSQQRKVAGKTSEEDKAVRRGQGGRKRDEGVRRKSRARDKTVEEVSGNASKKNKDNHTRGENSAGSQTRSCNNNDNSNSAKDDDCSKNDKDDDCVSKSDGNLTRNPQSPSTYADDTVNTNTGDSPRTNNRDSEQDEFLRMFLSTEHMDRDEEDPEVRGRGSPGARRAAWQYSEEAKKKHEKLIRKILDEFDLEKTKQKYRNAYVVERRRDGKSVADFQFRAELERMMGSEVIRLNDKNWSRQFTEKLLEDYYRYEEEQAHRRAEEEKMRVHKLKVMGLIHEPKVYNRRLTVCRFRKKRKSKTEEQIIADCQAKAQREESLLSRRQTLQEAQRVKLYRTSVAPNIEEAVRSSLQTDEESSSLSKSMTFFDEKRQKSIQKRRSTSIPEDVTKIYDEESVAGLYNMAAKLVYFR